MKTYAATDSEESLACRAPIDRFNKSEFRTGSRPRNTRRSSPRRQTLDAYARERHTGYGKARTRNGGGR